MVGKVTKTLAYAGVGLFATLVSPQAWACDLPPPETATVAAVLDGETLKLTDGKKVKLIGAKPPMPPLGWRGDDPGRSAPAIGQQAAEKVMGVDLGTVAAGCPERAAQDVWVAHNKPTAGNPIAKMTERQQLACVNVKISGNSSGAVWNEQVFSIN